MKKEDGGQKRREGRAHPTGRMECGKHSKERSKEEHKWWRGRSGPGERLPGRLIRTRRHIVVPIARTFVTSELPGRWGSVSTGAGDPCMTTKGAGPYSSFSCLNEYRPPPSVHVRSIPHSSPAYLPTFPCGSFLLRSCLCVPACVPTDRCEFASVQHCVVRTFRIMYPAVPT